MTRLVDLIPGGVTPPDEHAPAIAPADPVESVFEFPDRPQPSVVETLGRMVREVIVPGEPSPDEMDDIYAQAETMEAPAKGTDLRSAFDRGARLSMPEPPEDTVDPALKSAAKPRTRVPRRPSTSRPAGSDEFTDLFAAGMITIIAFSLGEDFQPTEEEAKDLARPLGNILARRIDLAAKLGQDSNDIVAFAIAMMAYGVRVGPIAAEKVRQGYSDRQRRARVDAVSGPGRTADSGESSSIPTRANGQFSPSDGAASSALDAVAQTRDAQLRVLGRGTGRSPRAGLPLADLG